MAILVTTPAAVPSDLVTLVKDHLRITNTDSDDLISGVYLPTAIDTFEKHTRRSLFTQTVKQTFDVFPVEDHIHLLRATPLDASPSLTVKYYNEDNQLVTFDAANYDILTTSVPNMICLGASKSWPTDLHPNRKNACEISYIAGYGTSIDNIKDKLILQAILLMCDNMFNFRGDQLYSPGGVLSLTEAIGSTSIRILDLFRTGAHEWRSQYRPA